MLAIDSSQPATQQVETESTPSSKDASVSKHSVADASDSAGRPETVHAVSSIRGRPPASAYNATYRHHSGGCKHDPANMDPPAAQLLFCSTTTVIRVHRRTMRSPQQHGTWLRLMHMAAARAQGCCSAAQGLGMKLQHCTGLQFLHNAAMHGGRTMHWQAYSSTTQLHECGSCKISTSIDSIQEPEHYAHLGQ